MPSIPNPLLVLLLTGTANNGLGASFGRNSLKRLTLLRSLYISAADFPVLSISNAVSYVFTGVAAFDSAHAIKKE